MEIRLEDLVNRYEKEIYRFAYRMTGDKEDAADVLQETFLRAFKSLRRLPDGSNYRAWLYRVAGRLALNLARAKKVRNSVPIEKALHLPEREGDLESLVETRRLARALSESLRRLSSRQRIALLLRKYEGLAYEEIAQALGCTEESARAHVYQGMNKVRRGLDLPKKKPGSKRPRQRRT